VKLIDFGISKLVGAAKPDGFRTSTGTSFGTPGYMPPEQIRGAQIDERCDLYAAGVVLYEMLSGTTPHPSTSYEDYVVRACTEPARPIRELVPDLPDHVDRAIMRALEPDPARRWTSTVAFARMLAGEAPTDAPTRRERSAEAATVMEIARPAEAATVVDAAQPPTVVDAPRPRRSARWPIIVAAAVVATAGAVAWRVSLADDARSVAAAPVVAETHDAAATGTHDAAEAGDAAIADAAPAPPRPEHRSPAPTARLDAKLAARACSGTLGWQACPLLVCGCAEGKEKASVCDGGVGGKDRCAPSAVTCGRACAKLGGWTGQVTDGASVGLARSDRDCLESDVCVQEKRCRLRGDECVKTGCRDTHACQRDGACKDPDEHDDAGLALRDNTCVVGSDADCAASTGCKTEGRCRLELVRHAITVGNLARCTK
jgi:hypothetical protein